MSGGSVDPMADGFTFGGTLARQRIALRMTQGQVVGALVAAGHEASVQSLSAWERDLYRPSDLAIVEALEQILDCPGELFDALGVTVGRSRLAALEERLESLESDVREILREIRGER